MNIYYVYIYRHPISNVPFYVGYGKNTRHLSHLREALSNPTPVSGEPKLNTIRKIIREGLEPVIQIVDRNLSKNDACELEEFLIELIGRRDKKTGPLTNLTKGGDGNRDWTPAARLKISKINRNMIIAKDPVTGERLKVHNTDPRWINGELVGQNYGEVNPNKNGKLTGYIQAKDPKTGMFFRVKPDDIRWTTGEIVGVNKEKPAHPNTIAAAKSKKGVPKSKEHGEKVAKAMKLLKWYCNFETNTVGRFKEDEQPSGFVRVTGLHKRTPI
jgi:hypothetical protein